MPTGRLREIITKAVCGRAQKVCLSTHAIEPKNTPAEVLGVRITGLTYTAQLQGQQVHITGSYEINIWYAYRGGLTDVVRQSARFDENIKIEQLSEMLNEKDVRATLVGSPRVSSCKVASNSVQVSVETEFCLEVIAETKMLVKAYGLGGDLYQDEKKDDDIDDLLFDDLEPAAEPANDKAASVAPVAGAEAVVTGDPSPAAAGKVLDRLAQDPWDDPSGAR